MTTVPVIWQLPAWVGTIWHELDEPKNMEEFRDKSRQWFDKIDFDLNGTISRREIRKEFERLEPPGLRWKIVGFNEPDVGREINNAALSSALMDGRIEFDKQELAIFNVSEMSYDSYIRVDQTYFKQDVDVKQIHAHADIFLEEFDADQNCTLDLDEFEASLILSLDNTVPGFNAAQVVTLWSIFQEVDNGDGMMVSIFIVF
jgi:hypothetical protein